MAVNINTFKSFVEFCENKVQSGNSVTVDQFNLCANRAQIQLFEKDYQTFMNSNTTQISEFLKVFLKNNVFSIPPNGEHAYPLDYQHLSALRKYYVNAKGVGKMIPIQEISDAEWGLIQISSLREPTSRFPKYNEFSNIIRFVPRNIGSVEVDYFKTPTLPVWGYTIVNNRPVYDPSTSVNFEWSEYSFNNVASIYLSLIGINLDDNTLIGWAQMYKQETNSQE